MLCTSARCTRMSLRSYELSHIVQHLDAMDCITNGSFDSVEYSPANPG